MYLADIDGKARVRLFDDLSRAIAGPLMLSFSTYFQAGRW